ncbi:putative Lecithin:cholesterol acyltransferase [Paratrimastix pyriformis]|uniref:Lecithin:cholesterol acyltransferase n=1 Tax=Paratrimastix pyriformis TaxID=342808 RepID=A0ABQ8U628_9EUKA|nr:putative Lecithin:cholesterol acyltransferase [Paratrimastix pyriformis]
MFGVALVLFSFAVWVVQAAAASSEWDGTLTLEQQTLLLGIHLLPNDPPPHFPARNYTERDPLILVPGMGGSRLQAQLHKQSHSPFFYCPSDSFGRWVDLWMSLLDFLPTRQACWAENIAASFNASTRAYSSIPGLRVRPVQGLSGVTHICSPLKRTAAYLGPMVEFLRAAGYRPGYDLFAAPYDFRLAGPEQLLQNGQFRTLKRLVERAHALSGRRVHIWGHSLGSPYVSHFLAEYVDQAWKDAHVASFISFGGPFAGCSTALPYSISDVHWRAVGMNPHLFSESVRSFACVPWLMPDPQIYRDEVVLITDSRNYTAAETVQALIDTGHKQQAVMALQASPYLDFLNHPPRVATHVFYGYGLTTPLAYSYVGLPSSSIEPKLIGSKEVERFGEPLFGTAYLMSLRAESLCCTGKMRLQLEPDEFQNSIRIRYCPRVVLEQEQEQEGWWPQDPMPIAEFTMPLGAPSAAFDADPASSAPDLTSTGSLLGLPPARPVASADLTELKPPEALKTKRRSGAPAVPKTKVHIEERNKRNVCFSKRKAGLLKKARELYELTGSQTLVIVASEFGRSVYSFVTPKFEPLIATPSAQELISLCLSHPPPSKGGKEKVDRDFADIDDIIPALTPSKRSRRERDDADDEDTPPRFPSATTTQVPVSPPTNTLPLNAYPGAPMLPMASAGPTPMAYPGSPPVVFAGSPPVPMGPYVLSPMFAYASSKQSPSVSSSTCTTPSTSPLVLPASSVALPPPSASPPPAPPAGNVACAPAPIPIFPMATPALRAGAEVAPPPAVVRVGAVWGGQPPNPAFRCPPPPPPPTPVPAARQQPQTQTAGFTAAPIPAPIGWASVIRPPPPRVAAPPVTATLPFVAAPPVIAAASAAPSSVAVAPPAATAPVTPQALSTSLRVTVCPKKTMLDSGHHPATTRRIRHPPIDTPATSLHRVVLQPFGAAPPGLPAAPR